MIRFIVGGLAVVTTLMYSFAAWYLSGLWSTLVTDTNNISLFSVYTIKPLFAATEFAMIHWQILALLSLIGNLSWASRKYDGTKDINQIALPLCCHITWLLFASFAHIAGCLISIVSVATVFS